MSAPLFMPQPRPDMAEVHSANRPVLPGRIGACRAAQATLRAADVSDRRLRSAADYLIAHGNWMDAKRGRAGAGPQGGRGGVRGAGQHAAPIIEIIEPFGDRLTKLYTT